MEEMKQTNGGNPATEKRKAERTLDVTELLNGRKNRLAFDYTFDETNLSGDRYALLPEDVTLLPQGIRVTGKIEDSDGYMTLSADVRASYETVCGRCLEPLQRTCSFHMDRLVRLGPTLENGEPDSGETAWGNPEEDLLYVVDGVVCPNEDIMEMLSLSLPMYHLCSEDCPGLCPHCGKRLRDGGCTCAEDEKNKKEIDPRLAKLQKLLENPKEV